MKLDVNKEYSGFVIRQAAYIDEIQSEAYVMEHAYSGARLLYLGNDDDNKVFSISFRTPRYWRRPYSGAFCFMRLAQIPLEGTLCRTGQRVDEHLSQCNDLS